MGSDDQTDPYYPAPDEAPGEFGGVTDYNSRSWPQRLAGAVTGALAGLALIGATLFGLSWNEGRAVQTARSLTEGANLVREADPALVDPALEGKLVRLAGEASTGSRLADPDFLVEAQALRLVRTVEIYQWRETRHTSTEKRLGGGEETVTTYSYDRAWSEQAIDSGRFRQPAGHVNPQPRFTPFEAVARDARVGAYRPGRAALQTLPATEALAVDAAAANRAKAQLGLKAVQAVDGRLYIGMDPGTPRVGDMRVGFRVMPDGPVTLIGRQAGADVSAFQTQAGDRLLLGSAGIVPAADLFKSAQSLNTATTWLLRSVFLLLMCCGWRLVFRPLAVIGDVVPLVGTLMEFGLGLLSVVLTLLLGPLVIAVAWLSYRPLVGVAALCAGVAAAVALRLAAARRTAPGPAAATFMAR